MNYYKHYMGDFKRDTGQLTLVQDGAYRRLMDHYYSTEEPLPADPDALFRICAAMDKPERAAVTFVAGKFFQKIGDELHHQRIDEELSKAQEKIANLKANAAEGGTKSGSSRASKKEANASANNQAETNNTKSSIHTSKPDGLEKKQSAQPAAVLPDWLPSDLWGEWSEYRKGIKARMTPHAERLCIAKLAKLRSAGHDPRAVVEQSIMSGKWTGLFPVKPDFLYRDGSKFDPVAHVNRNRKTA